MKQDQFGNTEPVEFYLELDGQKKLCEMRFDFSFQGVNYDRFVIAQNPAKFLSIIQVILKVEGQTAIILKSTDSAEKIDTKKGGAS